MENIGIASVAAITVICYLVGLCVKAVPGVEDKYIPICCGVAGAALAGRQNSTAMQRASTAASRYFLFPERLRDADGGCCG